MNIAESLKVHDGRQETLIPALVEYLEEQEKQKKLEKQKELEEQKKQKRLE